MCGILRLLQSFDSISQNSGLLFFLFACFNSVLESLENYREIAIDKDNYSNRIDEEYCFRLILVLFYTKKCCFL